MSRSKAFSSHPSSAILLDYVSGSLSFSHYCVVATHLLHCSECQDEVLSWERIENLLFADVQSVAPPPGLLERCLVDVAQHEVLRRRHREHRNEVGGITLPPSLQGLKPGRLRWLAPGIRHSTLWRDDRTILHLIRVRGGVTLPAHRHRGLELTCVLSGAYQDGGKLYTVGDVSEEDDDEDNPRREQDHLLVAEPPGDCICVMATTGRLRFSGWMGRLLQPVMPF